MNMYRNVINNFLIMEMENIYLNSYKLKQPANLLLDKNENTCYIHIRTIFKNKRKT